MDKNKKLICVELDNKMKQTELKILNILPHNQEKAIAIMLHLTSVLKKEFEIEQELIIEKD